MTPKDIEILAHDNRPMPKFTVFPDVCLYQAFANLYSRLNMNEIARDQAKIEKKRILEAYEQMKSEHERYMTVYEEHQNNIIRSGTLLSDIEKSDDAVTIALKACECIQILTGEFEFLKRQRKKLLKEENENA